MQYVCSESDSVFAVLLAAAMFVTSPAGAVAKYCDEYVCLCVCLSVCPRGNLQNHMHDLYQIFCASCLCPWLGRPPVC